MEKYMQNESSSVILSSQKELVLRSISFVLPIMAFTILTSFGALVRIPLPFTPVPITLQTFFVILAGLMLGANRGSISQLLYVLWGISGVPLFAGGAFGLAVITGPTGGYLIGFIIAAWLMGNRAQDQTSTSMLFVWATAATAIILTCGWLWLSLFLGKSMTVAFQLGVLPFIGGAIVKISAAVGLYQIYKKSGLRIPGLRK